MGNCLKNAKLHLDENTLSLTLGDYGTDKHPNFLEKSHKLIRQRDRYDKESKKKIDLILALPEPNPEA